VKSNRVEVLSAGERKKRLAAFARRETEEMGARVHEKYLKIAAQLEAKTA